VNEGRVGAEPLGIADADTFFRDCPIEARVFEFRGKCVRVLDGDTVVAWLDLGDGHLLATKVRFEHVNCPELSADGGPEAAFFTRTLMLDKWITVHTRSRREENGRLLASPYVWMGKNVPPLDVTLELVKAGHGTKR
jgi:endonuclease YncB( thermonuclease family)